MPVKTTNILVREKNKPFYEERRLIRPFLAAFNHLSFCFARKLYFERRLVRGETGERFSSEADQET